MKEIAAAALVCASLGLIVNGLSCRAPLTVEGKSPQRVSQDSSRPILQGVRPVGSAALTSDNGLPVKVLYYNLRAELPLVAHKLSQQFPQHKGWRHSLTDELAVFSCNNPTSDVKWQRIAVFKGQLDKQLQLVPNSDNGWVNVVVYRVMGP